MPTQLSVNLNKVATLRNTRRIGIPSVKHCARLCLDAGAAGITVHPRPDQRHIRPEDLDDLAEVIAEYPSVELNIEGNPFHGVVEYAERFRPAQCTLVPDDPAQSTSDHGWDLPRAAERLVPAMTRLRAVGCRASLFVDPIPENMAIAKQLGADRVELYTEPYAGAFTRGDPASEIEKCRDAALAAQRVGMGVNAGHDLNRENLGPFLTGVRGVLEVSIGHALVADALEFGLAETVCKYLAIVTAS